MTYIYLFSISTIFGYNPLYILTIIFIYALTTNITNNKAGTITNKFLVEIIYYSISTLLQRIYCNNNILILNTITKAVPVPIPNAHTPFTLKYKVIIKLTNLSKGEFILLIRVFITPFLTFRKGERG